MPLPLVIGILALAHIFDWVSFLVMIARHGVGAEANPIVAQVLDELGVPGVTVAKLATVVFAASLAVLVAPKRRQMAMVLLTFGVIAGLVGGITNVATF